MPDSQLLFAFFASAAVFAYAPGPSMLFAATQTISGGRTQGLQAALGIHLGGYFHVALVAMGIASLFLAVPMAYTTMKVLGSFYLCWLGITTWRSSARDQIDQTADISARASLEQQDITPRESSNCRDSTSDNTLFQSALVEILNPKTAIFYLAFLPQFTEPAAALPVAIQLLILGTLVNFLFSSADLICVFFAERILSASKQRLGNTYVAQKVSGGILVLLGAYLLLG